MQNSRLRVLVCAFACSPGGSKQLGDGEAVLGWNIVRQLARFHDLVVLTHPWNREGIEQSQAALGQNVQMCYFDAPRAVRFLRRWQGAFQVYAYLWQVKAYFVARRLHRERPFDLFHHVTYANDWMASYIGALLPVPYVRGPGGGAQQVPEGFASRFSRGGRFWERVRSAGQRLLRLDPVFLLGQSRARAILVCTPESLKAIPRRWRHKAQLFPVNGITGEDLRLTAREPDAEISALRPNSADPASDVEHKPFRVLSAGRLLELKAFDLAIRAFHRFAQKAPDAEFVLAGDGPELIRLERLIQKLGLGHQVRIEKWMPRDKLLRAMAESDVFLFASLRDGGGAVVIEAMAAGNPVICLDHAGPGMHVTEQCGIKVAPRNPDQAVEEMAEALFELYACPQLRHQMGKAARERAEQLYHWDRHGERLHHIFQNDLGLNPQVSLKGVKLGESTVGENG